MSQTMPHRSSQGTVRSPTRSRRRPSGRKVFSSGRPAGRSHVGSRVGRGVGGMAQAPCRAFLSGGGGFWPRDPRHPPPEHSRLAATRGHVPNLSWFS